MSYKRKICYLGDKMKQDKYIFNCYHSSSYNSDPVFKTNSFELYGNPEKTDEEPDLFEIHLDNQRRFRYCLIEPSKVCGNEELLLKIKRYLLAHEDNENLENQINTYFIGEMDKSIDASNGFTGQNCVLVTYEMIEQWYPKTPREILEKVVRFLLSRQKYLGQYHQFNGLSDDVLFVDTKLSINEKRDYRRFIEDSLKKEGYISVVSGGFASSFFVLTNKAIELFSNNNTENKVAFIAIKFDNNEIRINAIQDAIAKCGFEPVVMNHVETNNWIMPEIFHQIKNARFVVADFSLPCDGAYYEAGYAAALDKPVIHLFDKREQSESNKLHFDIAQKSTIFYSDFQDLKQRLADRIRATIK